jgi:seryl-tRNA synthetase
MMRMMEALDRLLSTYAGGRGAEPQLYPVTVSATSLLRSGYLKTFPQHAYFVAPAAFSRESLERIAAAADPQGLSAPGLLGVQDQVLAPTVCYHCFESLQGARFIGSRSFTALNHCSRFEVGDLGLARLHTFRMRELIGFGDPPAIVSLLDHALDWTTAALRRWDIGYRVSTATDPFFAGAQSGKVFFQSTFALKRELRLPLPYSGRWLAVGSFNNHQQSFTRTFDIGGQSLVSGCVGWGYERFILALLANCGDNPDGWPAALRTDFGFD